MADGQHTGRKIRRKDGQGYYTLGERLGEGGEGEVYAVDRSPKWAVKIYKPGRAPKDVQARKLLAMEGLMPILDGERSGHPSLTWPEQIIGDRKTNALIGLVMPRVNTAKTMTVGEFFIPSVRQKKLQEMNLLLNGVQIQKTKWNIIRNLSTTVARVHQQGHLVGDINQRNILVEPERGDVSIIDCDSFQIRDPENRIIYRCKVGMPEYTAPELLRQMQGPCNIHECPNGPDQHQLGYPCVSRNQEHDRFGIAVIAFQLLMDGSHPYDCRIEGHRADEANTRKEKIERGYYAYGRSKPRHIHVNNRDNERRFANLPPDVKNLFERAFGGA